MIQIIASPTRKKAKVNCKKSNLAGTIIVFVGAAFGSVVGGVTFFVPMLTLIIGFDQKSSTAISTCMVTGGAAATIFYNLRQRRPTIELPLIDHDLALLFQPMLVVGISTTTKSFFKAVETWKKETITKNVNLLDASKRLQPNGDGNEDVEDRNIPGGPSNGTTESKEAKKAKVSLLDSVCWKPFGVVAAVWVTIVALQIAVDFLFLLSCINQIPVAVGARGRTIASSGQEGANWRMHKLVLYCACGIAGGTVGGLLGLGGGFIMVHCFWRLGSFLRTFLEVSTATSTFIITFSSSIHSHSSLYFAAAASLSAVRGQNFGGKVIKALGRTYLIIFILAFTTLGSTVSLVDIANMVK
ncbi:hypothetical protein PRUPE_3G064600 [Prunus persica]|uniref:Uncharacterized protein n=1 Tax=Prunus persica TaxID=3760 RepID=M5WV20_PRUPE|nr:hypothetical protein PRUPE_3G064600 [Prunus persica]